MASHRCTEHSSCLLATSTLTHRFPSSVATDSTRKAPSTGSRARGPAQLLQGPTGCSACLPRPPPLLHPLLSSHVDLLLPDCAHAARVTRRPGQCLHRTPCLRSWRLRYSARRGESCHLCWTVLGQAGGPRPGGSCAPALAEQRCQEDAGDAAVTPVAQLSTRGRSPPCEQQGSPKGVSATLQMFKENIFFTFARSSKLGKQPEEIRGTNEVPGGSWGAGAECRNKGNL